MTPTAFQSGPPLGTQKAWLCAGTRLVQGDGRQTFNRSRTPWEKVERLRGVSFDWKQKGGGHDIGLIAEEVGEVIPEVVSYAENGKDAIGLGYARLTAVLIEAVKEQQSQIRELQAEIQGLKTLEKANRGVKGISRRPVRPPYVEGP